MPGVLILILILFSLVVIDIVLLLIEVLLMFIITMPEYLICYLRWGVVVNISYSLIYWMLSLYWFPPFIFPRKLISFMVNLMVPNDLLAKVFL